MKPVIAIAGNHYYDQSETIKSKTKCAVEEDYIQAVLKAGGLPVIIPVLSDHKDLEQLLSGADGLLLMGGGDIDPRLYRQNPSEQCGPVQTEVDRFYVRLIHLADKMEIPVFGICKGCQALNVAFGGTLNQDLGLEHVQKESCKVPSHDCRLCQGCSLYEVLKDPILHVNSFHHQSVDDVAGKFHVAAYGQDGVVEAIEKTEGTYMLGVQWHPEMLLAGADENSLMILKHFVARCAH